MSIPMGPDREDARRAEWRHRDWTRQASESDWDHGASEHLVFAARPTTNQVSMFLDISAERREWVDGQWVRLKDHALPAETRRLVIEHETRRKLPLIGRTEDRIRTGIELLHIHVGRPDSVVELGPYPPGKITVRGIP